MHYNYNNAQTKEDSHAELSPLGPFIIALITGPRGKIGPVLTFRDGQK